MVRLLITVFAVSSVATAATCESLLTLAMPDTSVTSATADTVRETSFCRVRAVARPVTDSEIQIEVWLPPAASWNGKLLGTGNGGYSGAMSLPAMQAALRDGYAVTGSDTGHPGGDLKFGQGHPEKIADWAYRAVHVMTDVAKLTARNYYGRFPDKAYFTGCSTGGQQALTEAQRYPTDYDGIIAGDPGHDRIHLNIGFLWSWAAAREVLTVDNLRILGRAVVEKCDIVDGLKDGLIDDPRRCRFDPATLLCKGAEATECLNSKQIAAIQKIYDGAKNPRTHEQIFPGWIQGSEGGWGAYFVGHAEPARVDFWRLWLFGDLKWDPTTFDYDRDVAFADSKLAMVSATDTNLGAFRRNQGKLLMYHGWADPVVPPQSTIQYYDSIRGDFVRLFMVPGMGHCQGGPGPTSFDALAALDAWVTKGTAPVSITASHSTAGKVDRTRPLCPYPQVARGDSCVAPPK